jgi:hypothetical protein
MCVCAFLIASVPVMGQQQPPQQPSVPAPQTPPSDGKVRIYVTDSQSWEMVGGWGEHGSVSQGQGSFSGGGYTAGGARPQTAEIIKTFNQRCPEYTVTSNKDRANYAVLLDHEGGKKGAHHKNKIVVFNRDGDAIFSNSTIVLGNAVKDACAAIEKDQGEQKK